MCISVLQQPSELWAFYKSCGKSETFIKGPKLRRPVVTELRVLEHVKLHDKQGQPHWYQDFPSFFAKQSKGKLNSSFHFLPSAICKVHWEGGLWFSFHFHPFILKYYGPKKTVLNHVKVKCQCQFFFFFKIDHGLFRVIGPIYGGEPPPVFAFFIFWLLPFIVPPYLHWNSPNIKPILLICLLSRLYGLGKSYLRITCGRALKSLQGH